LTQIKKNKTKSVGETAHMQQQEPENKTCGAIHKKKKSDLEEYKIDKDSSVVD
jgi:hypothetical protein